MQSNSGSNRHRHESDSYCWSCHRPEPDLYCSTCVRAFHMTPTCSSEKRLFEEESMNWRCPECKEIENGIQLNKMEKIDATHQKKVLNYIMEHLIDDKTFNKLFMDIEYPRGTVANTMDLRTIDNKIEIGAYSCCEDFFSDIKWIVHNTKIHCSDDRVKIKMVNLLSNAVKEEMYCIRLCHSCYMNLDDDWFTIPCSKPHILVWAKQRTYPYWPAKVMRYNSGQNTVDVQYFGEEHFRAVLPTKDCLLYSKRCPSMIRGGHRQSHAEAREEAARYIENLIDKYGSFKYAEPITVLNGNFLERHLYEMIPNAWKNLGRSVVPPPIPKPTPSSATVARRMSLPAKRTNRRYSVAPQVFPPGRIMTRRMSAIVDAESIMNTTMEESTTTEESAHNTQTPPGFLHCSIQMDRLPPTTTNLPSFIATMTKGKHSVGEPPAKYAKASDESRRDTTPTASSSFGTSQTPTAADDAVFKVPMIPKKRKFSLANKLTEKTTQASVQCDEAPTNPGSKVLATQQVVDTDPNSEVFSSEPESNPEIYANDPDCNVSSGLDSNEASAERDVTQQSVEDLRNENRALRAELKKYKDLYDSAMNGHEGGFKSKFDAMSVDLAKAEAKIADTVAKLSELVTQNALLEAENVALRSIRTKSDG